MSNSSKKNIISITNVKKSKLSCVDFDNIIFGKITTDHMFITNFKNNCWNNMKIIPYGNISISPSMTALHYGQTIFEGLKAYKTINNKIVLFRPRDNWIRFNKSAKRMCMPEIKEDIFINAITKLVNIDKNWIYNKKGYSLYIRPFMFASDKEIGIKPSKNYKFIIFCMPCNLYYKKPLTIKIETQYTRSAKGGIGHIKSGCNYGPSLYPTQKAINKGFDQILWTDSNKHQYIEELSTANIFFVINNTIVTPITQNKDTLLSGITRDSVLKIASKMLNIKVKEVDITVNQLIDHINNNELSEAFAVGTAATITYISKINHNNIMYRLPLQNNNSISNKILSYLNNIFYGEINDSFNWLLAIN